MMPWVGKSGPLTHSMQASNAVCSSASGFSSSQKIASANSLRLCGGMFVAIPTAIPPDPFISRFGTRDGRTAGSLVLPS